MEEPVSTKFMVIPPRHQRALEMLVDQKHRDRFGGIGVGAMREEDDVLTLEQIVEPLAARGLVEDLTQTEMGESGRFFVRITRLGELCLSLGGMLREQRKMTEDERRWITPLMNPTEKTVGHLRIISGDPSEEKEAIA